MKKEYTCCFTGHRKLPADRIIDIVKNLNDAVERLIDQGVTNFISGGAVGFDQIAASLIVAKKEMGVNIRLIFVLPCPDQDLFWEKEPRELFHNLLHHADEIIYLSEKYEDGCMEKRNRYMVDQSAYCICALLYPNSGTGQTVRYAEKKGTIIHLI